MLYNLTGVFFVIRIRIFRPINWISDVILCLKSWASLAQEWPFAYSAQIHYLNQGWIIVNKANGGDLQELGQTIHEPLR